MTTSHGFAQLYTRLTIDTKGCIRPTLGNAVHILRALVGEGRYVTDGILMRVLIEHEHNVVFDETTMRDAVHFIDWERLAETSEGAE